MKTISLVQLEIVLLVGMVSSTAAALLSYDPTFVIYMASAAIVQAIVATWILCILVLRIFDDAL